PDAALAQVLARDGAGSHAHDRFTRRRSSAAAIVAQAVLVQVGVVGVTGAEAILDLVVVARALVLVFDQQPDGRTGGAALEHPGQDAHLIGFLALAGVARGAGAPSLDIRLQVGFIQRQPRRTAVDDAAQ